MKIAMGSFLILPFLIGCSASAPPPAGAQSNVTSMGADSSGGGDLKSPEDGSAWFLGKDKTVHVCYETGTAFLGRFDLASEISKAFAQWKKYYESKNPTLSIPPNTQVI